MDSNRDVSVYNDQAAANPSYINKDREFIDFRIIQLSLKELLIDKGYNIAGIRVDRFFPTISSKGGLEGNVVVATEAIAIVV